MKFVVKHFVTDRSSLLASFFCHHDFQREKVKTLNFLRPTGVNLRPREIFLRILPGSKTVDIVLILQGFVIDICRKRRVKADKLEN